MPKTTPPLQLRSADGRIELGTFLSLATQREYIDRRTGERWPAKMIDTIFAPIVPLDANGNPLRTANKKVEKLRASEWLDRYHRVDQQVWAPGEPEIILDRVLRKTGWKVQPGARCFNLYDPPEIEPGDPAQATPWIELVRKVYPDDADHIIKWLAFKLQNPGVKINHALVLGGSQGIGKDTILAPVAVALGPGNFKNISYRDQRFKYIQRKSRGPRQSRHHGITNGTARMIPCSKPAVQCPPFMVRRSKACVRDLPLYAVRFDPISRRWIRLASTVRGARTSRTTISRAN